MGRHALSVLAAFMEASWINVSQFFHVFFHVFPLVLSLLDFKRWGRNDGVLMVMFSTSSRCSARKFPPNFSGCRLGPVTKLQNFPMRIDAPLGYWMIRKGFQKNRCIRYLNILLHSITIAYHIVLRKYVEICWVVQHAQSFHSLRWHNKKPSLWHNRTAAAPRAASLESQGATWSGYSGNQWQWECHGISPNMKVL
jgi:hypothetical protein